MPHFITHPLLVAILACAFGLSAAMAQESAAGAGQGGDVVQQPAPPSEPAPAAGQQTETANAAPAQQQQPGQAGDSLFSQVRIQTFPAITFLHGSVQTDFGQLGEVAAKVITDMHASAKQQGVNLGSPTIFIYHGMIQDPSKPFTLDIGYAVPPDTTPFGQFKVKTLEPFRCATLIYSGPVAIVSQAYGKLMTEMTAAGLTPTGESREFFLYWEAIESPNNIAQIQIGVK